MSRVTITASAELLERVRGLLGLANDESLIDHILEEAERRASLNRLADLLGSRGEESSSVPRRRPPWDGDAPDRHVTIHELLEAIERALPELKSLLNRAEP